MLNTPRRLLITIAVLLAWRLGLAIPVPGPILPSGDLQVLNLGPQWFWQTLGRKWSILELGITPLFWVLMSVELLKIALPEFRRWEAADRQGKARLRLYIFMASLAFAAIQALGLLSTYEQLAEPLGTVFEVAFVMSLVAGAALMCWFADVITRYGIGNGFWMLLGLPILAALAKNSWLYLGMLLHTHERASRVWWYPSYIPTQAELEWVAIGLIFVAIFFLVFVLYPRLNFRGSGDTPQNKRDPWAEGGLMATVWPPVLANWVASWLVLVAMAFKLSTDFDSFAMIAAGIVLIPLFTILREKGALRQNVEGNLSQEETMPILTLALVQTVIWAIPLFWKQLDGQFPLFMGGYHLIIATTIALDLARRLFYLRERTELQVAAPSV